MNQTWRLLKYEIHDASYNMAIDEAMLTVQSKWDLIPALRFYGWRRPAFSFGYFQNIDEEVDVEACRKSDVDLVRRPTGGGMVIHGWDLTYTLIARLDNPRIPYTPLESYRLIGQCIVEALKNLDIEAYTSTSTSNSASDVELNVCLAKSALFDVMIDKKKVAGAAQRRRKGVLLNQGYISLDTPPEWMISLASLASKNSNLVEIVHQNSICVNSVLKPKPEPKLKVEELLPIVADGFMKTLGIQLVEEKLSDEECKLADQLQSKYKSDEWNFKYGLY